MGAVLADTALLSLVTYLPSTFLGPVCFSSCIIHPSPETLKAATIHTAAMADPLSAIGATASIFDLISFSVKIGKALREICKTFKEEPEQIKTVRNDVKLVQARLECLRKILDNVGSGQDRLSQELKDIFQESTERVRKAFETIEKVLDSLKSAWGAKSDASFQAKFKWAVQDKKRVDQLKKQLRDAESGLSSAIDLFSM